MLDSLVGCPSFSFSTFRGKAREAASKQSQSRKTFGFLLANITKPYDPQEKT
jgi:hypothetical protein